MGFKTENYLPSRLSVINEFHDFCVANDPEFDNAGERLAKGLNNRFPDTADIDGVKRWEGILGITPNASDTLEDRRFRILTYFQKRTPYTWPVLHRMMAFLCGEDNYSLEKEEDFILKASISLNSESKLKSVIRMLEEVVPMHILIDLIVRYQGTALVRVFSAYQETIIIETLINRPKTIIRTTPYVEQRAVIETLIDDRPKHAVIRTGSADSDRIIIETGLGENE